MAKELFRPLYSPPGYKYKDAKAAGLLRESETYWIRLRHQGRTIRKSTKTDKFDLARQFLSEKRRVLPRVSHRSDMLRSYYPTLRRRSSRGVTWPRIWQSR